MSEQKTPCDKLFDDDGNEVCEGALVRVNGEYVGKVHIKGEMKFHIEGWPADEIIQSLEVV